MTSLRYQLNYAVPHSKLERHLHSFLPSSIHLWNRLPNEIELSPDLLKFKSAVQNVQLTQPTSNHVLVFLLVLYNGTAVLNFKLFGSLPPKFLAIF